MTDCEVERELKAVFGLLWMDDDCDAPSMDVIHAIPFFITPSDKRIYQIVLVSQIYIGVSVQAMFHYVNCK